MSELLAERQAEHIVGRERELGVLLEALDAEAQAVVYFVHGIAGVGKTTLLQAFAARVRAEGAAALLLDARQIEPTEEGFLHELELAAGGDIASVEQAAERLASLGSRVVIILDTYEVFALMDTWLRRVFIPALDPGARLVLAGREPPIHAWHNAPEWRGLFRSVALDPLQETDALALLARSGVAPAAASRINRIARGHPLALTLAATAITEGSTRDIEDTAAQSVIEALSRTYLAEIDDPVTRDALEASSGVRRVTEPLLAAMLPDVAPRDAYARLEALPFVQVGRDGLVVHDAVRQAIATHVRAADAGRYRDYRWRAWECLRDQIREAPRDDVWRYTADVLYLIEHPVIREAFFPSGAQPVAVDPARPSDGPAIGEIIDRHEGPTAASHLHLWWNHHPETFRVFRDGDDRVVGFYARTERHSLGREVLQRDPAVIGWMRHLRDHPVDAGETVIFSRRWMDHERGELPSATQAAAWRDIKGLYVSMRDTLRRIYMVLNDLEVYGDVAATLGFQIIEHGSVTLDGKQYHSAFLDFGPEHVDGWLARHVVRELGRESDRLVDHEARLLRVNGSTVPLSPLEFGVIAALDHRRGKAVSRAELIEHVWGYTDDDGGSNVVDVVVRSLRRKLGPEAGRIETVRGTGYRLRSD